MRAPLYMSSLDVPTIFPALPSTPSPYQPTPSPSYQSVQNANCIARSKKMRHALNRRSASIAFLNEQWNGPDWLPPDIRAGLASVNLSHPADAVVRSLREITDILLEQHIPLQSV
jgi:hypothetical protein